MQNEQIFKQAVEKAHYVGGYNYPYSNPVSMDKAAEVIFSHEFAEAFFGGNWETRLCLLVLSSDRYAYLAKFLPKPQKIYCSDPTCQDCYPGEQL